MDSVIDPRELPLRRPAKPLLLLLFQALELLDEMQFEFDGDPIREFECDVFVRIGPAITPGIGEDADGLSNFHPFFRGKQKGIEPGALSKPLEFEGVKMGVV